MRQLFVLLSLLLMIPVLGTAQTQTLKGTIIDKQSEIPLIGASVQIADVEPLLGATTDLEGRFSIPNVPLGRQVVQINYLGYEPISIPNVVVTSGKEVILNIGMEESINQINEVVVTAAADKDKAQNEMATISARTFSLEEVTRYSGGRNDISRLASNFAGVSTADDSRNDIVIRGNAPTGLLWRLEGVAIPNPNHFSTLGTTGGPVSAINPNILRNSDFLTSAFPAEYGNSLGGVFDLGFRTGNRDRFEYTFQLNAFSGLEGMVEGPINREKTGSFALAYRYSFVGIGASLGIPVGTAATPNYQDLSFKIDLPKGKAGKFSIFGLGGLSDIDFLGAEIDETDLFADPNEDAFPRSQLGIFGVKHNYLLNETTYIRTVALGSISRNTYTQDNFLDDGTKYRATEVEDWNNSYTITSFVNKKFSPRLNARVGLTSQTFYVNTFVDNRDENPDLDEDGLPDLVRERDFEGFLPLFQTFVQTQYKINNRLTLNTGLHAQLFTFNNSYSIEPRIAFNYEVANGHVVNLGYGLHSQMQPLPVFFLEIEDENGIPVRSNEDLDFNRSHHFVLGYDFKPAADWRIKVETYYQHLFNIAVESTPGTFSILNAGADFVFPEEHFLVNDGQGRNYGVELTIEKFFSKGFYGLFTASVYDSEYKASDGVWRNTAFNNQYVLNVLGGKEFKVGREKLNAMTIDFKVATAGGPYFTPVDLESSIAAGREILFEELAFSERNDYYFRFDLKFGFTKNSRNKRLSQQFFIDLSNVTGRENVFQQRYNDLTQQVNTVNQQGFFPDLLYRIQF
ncbi:MAG: TonB-dependent receptor [Bacteroidota bacterium]